MRLLDKVPPYPQRKPGDMYYVDWSLAKRCHSGWSNCNHKHLVVVLPNMDSVDLHGRANNCTMPDDRTHRCWIIHGTPPNITVDKDGHTCQAGAGSIVVGDWHGFIRNGEFIQA